MNAREDLIRTYNEKEIDLNEKFEREKNSFKQMQIEMRALKNYARQLKYLCEDWAPVGVPLPEVLSRPVPVKLDDEMLNPTQRDWEAQIDRLKRRNRKLEEEMG